MPSLLEVERSSRSSTEVKKFVITSSVSLSSRRDSGLKLRKSRLSNSTLSLPSRPPPAVSRSPSSQGGEGGPLFRTVVMAKRELLADNRGSAEVKKSDPVMTRHKKDRSEMNNKDEDDDDFHDAAC